MSNTDSKLKLPQPFSEGDIGVKVVESDDPPEVDLVVLHGIGADPVNTWKYQVKDQSPVDWVGDKNMLLASIKKSRIMRYGYDSNWVGTLPLNQQLRFISMNLLSGLSDKRRECTGRPLILIGHCFGGVVLMDAFKTAYLQSRYKDIFTSAIGFIFMGTPFQGATESLTESLPRDVSDLIYKAAENIEPVKMDTALLDMMKRDAKETRLLELLDEFLQCCKASKNSEAIACFVEGRSSVKRKLYGIEQPDEFVVDWKHSTIPGALNFQWHKDHYLMNKFSGLDDHDYRQLIATIKDFQKDAPNTRAMGHSGTTPDFNQQSMLPGRHDGFVGRESEAAQISHLLEHRKRAGLVGFGGTGKTQLALEIGYRYRESHPTHWVFWIHANNENVFLHDFGQLSDFLDVDRAGRMKLFQVLQATFRKLSNPQTGKWLLIIDNADDIDYLFHELKDGALGESSKTHRRSSLSEYIPQTGNGRILITSQTRSSASRLVPHDSIIQLGELSRHHAMQLLRQQISSESFDHEAASRLVDRIGGVPLSLTQVASYLSAAGETMTLHGYCDLLEASETSSRLLLKNSLGDPRRHAQANHSVLQVINISVQKIKANMPAASDLLSLMSVLDRQRIPDYLLQRKIKDATQYHNVMMFLNQYCMISSVNKGSRAQAFTIHSLVVMAVRDWLDDQKMMKHWQTCGIALLSKAFPSPEFDNWMECADLRPHAHAVLQNQLQIESGGEDRAELLHNLARYDVSKGQWALSMERYSEAIIIRSRLFGPTDANTLWSEVRSIWPVVNSGNLAQARHLAERVLSDCIQHLGKDHKASVKALGYLQVINNRIGKSHEALKQSDELLQLLNADRNTERSELFMAQNNRIEVLRALNLMEDAETSAKELLTARTVHLGINHPDTLYSMNNLARILENRSKFDDALRWNQMARLGRKFLFGKQHPEYIISLADRSLILGGLRRHDEELECRQEAVELSKQINEPTSQTANLLNGLAIAYSRQGNFAEAEAAITEAIELGTEGRFGGRNHPETLMDIGVLATILWKQGKDDEAIEYARQCFEGRKQFEGVRHGNTLFSAVRLATILQGQGKITEAESHFTYVMTIQDDLSTTERLEDLDKLHSIALKLDTNEETATAIRLLGFAIKDRCRLLGGNDAIVLERRAILNSWRSKFG